MNNNVLKVPGKIEKVVVLNPGNQYTDLIVKWDPPPVSNGIITGYLLNVSTSSSIVYLIPNIKNNTISLSNLSKQFMCTFHSIINYTLYL